MPTTLTKLVTATIVLTLSAVVPGCSCSYSSSTGSKGTQAPTSTGKPINNSGKPAGTSKATSGSEGTSKTVSKGEAVDDAAEPADEVTKSPASNPSLGAPEAAEPDPGPVSGKTSGTTISNKTAAGSSTRTSND